MQKYKHITALCGCKCRRTYQAAHEEQDPVIGAKANFIQDAIVADLSTSVVILCRHKVDHVFREILHRIDIKD